MTTDHVNLHPRPSGFPLSNFPVQRACRLSNVHAPSMSPLSPLSLRHLPLPFLFIFLVPLPAGEIAFTFPVVSLRSPHPPLTPPSCSQDTTLSPANSFFSSVFHLFLSLSLPSLSPSVCITTTNTPFLVAGVMVVVTVSYGLFPTPESRCV